MNSLNVWTGYHYAWIENRGNGEGEGNKPNDYAKRVRIQRKVERYAHEGAKRVSTYFIVTLHEDNGDRMLDRYGREIDPFEVRARDIVTLWTDYERDRNHRLADKRAEQQRYEDELLAARQKENEFKRAVIERLSLPEGMVTITSGSSYILISRKRMEQLLEQETPAPTITQAVSTQAVPVPAPIVNQPEPVLTPANSNSNHNPVSDVWDYFPGGEDEE